MNKYAVRFGILISAILILGLSAGFASQMYAMVRRLPVRQYFAPAVSNGAWDWKNPVTASAEDIEASAQWLYRHQFNTVYIDLSSVAAGESDGMDQALDTYIGVMDRYKIRVLASGGDTDWSKPENRHLPLAILDYAHYYNERNATYRLAGVEYDIESYNQEGFADASLDRKGVVLTEFLDTVDTIASKQEEYASHHANQQLELGFSVPYWLDNENKNIKSVTWLGKTGPAIYHLMDRLNKLPRSNVIVMAYRNAARGNDGVIAHSRTEIEYAQYKASNVKVVIGQEVTEVEPAKITYYGQSITELSREMDWVKQEFTRSSVLGGVAVNDLHGLLAMPDN